MNKKNMKTAVLTTLVSLTSMLMISCGPPRVDPIVEINPNETAFVVPLEINTASQEKFESIEFLQSQQVAAKRIVIPQRVRDTGRMWYDYEWIPTQKVISVDRTPVTRSWTYSPKEFKSDKKFSTFGVESRDSIGFQVGVNVSALIDEKDAAKYLYYYRGNALADVIDSNVREKVHTILSREFGARTLQEIKEQRQVLTTALSSEVSAHFIKYGITVTSIGLAEGLQYEQAEIQTAINNAYVAEMEVERQKQEVRRQEELNKQMILKAKGEQEQAQIFAATAEERKKLVSLQVQQMQSEALLDAVKKWNGVLPKFINGGNGAGMLLQMSDSAVEK